MCNKHAIPVIIRLDYKLYYLRCRLSQRHSTGPRRAYGHRRSTGTGKNRRPLDGRCRSGNRVHAETVMQYAILPSWDGTTLLSQTPQSTPTPLASYFERISAVAFLRSAWLFGRVHRLHWGRGRAPYIRAYSRSWKKNAPPEQTRYR